MTRYAPDPCPHPCDCCANRADHVYRINCKRCESRLLARSHSDNEIERLPGVDAAMRSMVADERELDSYLPPR